MSTILRHRFGALAECLLFGAAATASVHAVALPVLRIDTDKVIARVSPLHAGLFVEEVSHAFDGGLYAELVGDRTLNGALFVKPGALGAWRTIGGSNSSMAMTVDWSNPVSEAVPASLRVDAGNASPGHRVGVANTGFWGIPVHPNTRYRVSFYAKIQGDFAGPLTVSIEDADGTLTFASFQMALSPGSWKHYVANLITSSGAASSRRVGRLAISTEQPGTFWLTQVSLFPPTWNARPNGQRIDLMQKLTDLNPKFLRFPGGCNINGCSFTGPFDWKKTLGAMGERPGHQGDYWTSDGMGYLEFLQWCEMFGMEPVLAVYAGGASADGIVSAGDALQPFVQNALDEIEYATGDTSTEWGKRRGRDGHPAPFKVGYVEIGNEEIDPAYDARFSQFYDVIKAKYPSIQIIATGQIKDTGTQDGLTYRKACQVKSRVPDMLDEHFYLKAKDMFAEIDLFDHYDRTGPKILVGEWAAVEGGPPSNMLGALGDAAWMIGMERNSDLVVMQSYSELLVNVNKHAFTWPTGLIGYDALGSYGSPSYYAQLMFNAHRGDEVLASTTEVAPGFFTSVTRDSKTKTIYVKAVNTAGAHEKVKIEIAGRVKIKPKDKVIELTGDPTDANSIEEPTKIAPVEHSLNDASAAFEHTFPQYSVTVLELHTH